MLGIKWSSSNSSSSTGTSRSSRSDNVSSILISDVCKRVKASAKMSHADNTPRGPAQSRPPEACRGCSGLQPRPALVDVEDMGKSGVEKLISKAKIAQRMLTDIMEELTKLQASQRCPREGKQKSKFLRGSRYGRGRYRSNSFSFFVQSSNAFG